MASQPSWKYYSKLSEMSRLRAIAESLFNNRNHGNSLRYVSPAEAYEMSCRLPWVTVTDLPMDESTVRRLGLPPDARVFNDNCGKTVGRSADARVFYNRADAEEKIALEEMLREAVYQMQCENRLVYAEAVIGLEVHVQIRTNSKMFCSCENRYGAEPNTLTCPVCLGYPGTLPVPNHEAILKAVRAGLLTGCEIAKFSKFDRKSYFYPDLVKNYQISQYDLPFCKNGKLRIGGTGFSGEALPDKVIGITRIHLEEDPAKLNHMGSASGADYNRSGVPLLEVVSEPDMRSADEAYAYLAGIKEIMQYGGISDCDMEKGQMRCDVNISLRPVGQKEFGTKIELKNMNSFRAAHRAIEYEIWRQAELLDRGETLRQETRGWNDDAGESYLMRTKEEAHDYRYFPDPDLMPVTFTDAEIEAIRAELPELPAAMRERFLRDYGLTEYDAGVMTQSSALASWFDRAAKASKSPKLVANWIGSELLRMLGETKCPIDECRITPENLAELVDLIEQKTINGKIAKEVFPEMFETGKKASEIVKEKGLVQVSDSGAIAEVVSQAIAANPAQVEQYRSGNAKVLQFLVGQVMKLSKGKANPQLVVAELKKQLG